MCPICKRNDKIITDTGSGEVICSNCGTVVSDKLQDIGRPERRAFNVEEKNIRIRTGMPASIAFADMGLATIIAKHDRDASGHPLNAEMRAIMQRLRKWDLRTHSISPNDRNLTRAFNELNMIKRRTCSIRCGSRGNLRTFIERFSKEG